MRKIMLIDVELCHDCNNCFMACKDEHCGNSAPDRPAQPHHGHRWMNILRRERGQYPMIDMAFLPMPCQQCGNPACAGAACGIVKGEDGIVTVDCAVAKGGRAAVSACPYGAMYYNEGADCPQKCDFCMHLLREGAKLPRCVEVCPTGALKFKEVTEQEYDALLARGWEKYGSDDRPGVLYRNLGRFTQHFVGGSVIHDNDCLEGAKATIMKDGQLLGSMFTNGFGDFKFDRLEPGEYTVSVTWGVAEKKQVVKVDDAVSLGVIEI